MRRVVELEPTALPEAEPSTTGPSKHPRQSDGTDAPQPDTGQSAPQETQQRKKGKRRFSEEHRRKLAEAARQRWALWRAAHPDRSPTPPKDPGMDRRRLPKSPETRAKIAAAATGRRWGLDVRYRMSRSHAGKVVGPEGRQRMAEGQRRRRAREGAERGPTSGATAAGSEAAAGSAPPPMAAALEREAAVIELSRLRQRVFGWMDAYEAQHGRKPSLPETAEIAPDIYKAFVRYVGLRDMLRRGGGGGGGGGGGPVARAAPAPGGGSGGQR